MAATELPVDWVVSTFIETVVAPQDPGQTPSTFARWTTTVVDENGILMAASGDRQDAINQALSIVQADAGVEAP